MANVANFVLRENSIENVLVHASLGSKAACDVISDITISDDETKFQTFSKDDTTSGTVSNCNTFK